MKQILPTLICLGFAAAFASAQNSFYAQPPLFSYSPDETKSLTTIKHLGAVGMGIDLIQPAFRMQIHTIDTHTRHLFKKLDVRSRAAVVACALRERMV